ncbi:hypothetical protein [Martelella sp. HB161492]|uniref:hypothetical protein n=1 Tax=Martelella sp. HB161492 TaxID=2720726 RepID=UPI001591FEB4|nr:hypothetical protein [Martelella sp. HB161492]
MLAAEAMRLAAMEALNPTAANAGTIAFPTLAGKFVYDSRSIALEDLDRTRDYTPTLALFTSESHASSMGEAAAMGDTSARATLEIVAELAVVAQDGDGEFADAADMAQTDTDARLVLAALCSQVRCLLQYGNAGLAWRRVVKQVAEVREQAFASPELGLRYHRTLLTFVCDIADDEFDLENGGLPEPLLSVFNALPENSYAKEKLAALASHFTVDARTPLEVIHGDIGSGLAFEASLTTDP